MTLSRDDTAPSARKLPPVPPGGPIAWMSRNHVAANILMAILIIGGLLFASRVKQEVFPDFSLDLISVSVPYPGASPEEVEQGILLSIEDGVRGLDGVKDVTSQANEGLGALSIELLTGADSQRALQDVKNAVDRIQSFPELAERPVVSLIEQRNQVLSLLIHGDVDESTIRNLAETTRDDLLQLDDVTLAELGAVRPLEIAIEIPQATLRELGLTLPQVAGIVRRTAIELPAGGVRTDGGEILLRTQERRDYAREYADIAVATTADGTIVRLGEIADIRDDFEETDQETFFEGRRAARVDVYRVGNETPQSVSDAVRGYLREHEADLPPGIGMTIWNDSSEIYRERMQLLIKNAFLGLALVLLILGLFLDPKLAFWVTLGIPISILGSFLFIPLTGASINMISLFAFIVTLGIIVDDAVVMGENIFEMRQKGYSFAEAAIVGARQIAGPITFAVLTNIVAFMPLFFVPGASGNLFLQIPSITVAVFVVSLVESLFILPAHLSTPGSHSILWRALAVPNHYFSRALQWVIDVIYAPSVRVLVRFRYATFAGGLALLLLAVGTIAGGHLRFSFLPRIDSDVVTVQATLPFGVAVDRSREVQEVLLESARRTLEETGGPEISRGIFTQIGAPIAAGVGGPPEIFSSSGSHVVGIQVFLVPSGQRDISGVDFAEAWRANTPRLPGLESMTFNAQVEAGGGAPVDIQLSHRDTEVLEAAAEELAGELEAYAGITDLDDGFARGKPQLSFRLKPEARSLGMTAADLAEQVRGAFYGSEALRQQRGRNEVKVLVRLPETERSTLQTVEELVLRTPGGGEIPLREAATIEEGRAYTRIERREGRRTLSVTADVDENVSNANKILAEVRENELPALLAKYPGLGYSLEGEQANQRDTFRALGMGFALAMLVVYGLLAVPFRSYWQPVIVMLSIPFGLIGAVVGHFLLGYGLSMISIFGLIALAGVVVNDSLVLVVTANEARDRKENDLIEAVCLAGERRFRPILLTSLTTFFGLAPMIFETSMQARFLIPMAISIGFGILFATFIILGLVPAVYVILEDVKRGVAALVRAAGDDEPGDGSHDGSSTNGPATRSGDPRRAGGGRTPHAPQPSASA